MRVQWPLPLKPKSTLVNLEYRKEQVSVLVAGGKRAKKSELEGGIAKPYIAELEGLRVNSRNVHKLGDQAILSSKIVAQSLRSHSNRFGHANQCQCYKKLWLGNIFKLHMKISMASGIRGACSTWKLHALSPDPQISSRSTTSQHTCNHAGGSLASWTRNYTFSRT